MDMQAAALDKAKLEAQIGDPKQQIADLDRQPKMARQERDEKAYAAELKMRCLFCRIPVEVLYRRF